VSGGAGPDPLLRALHELARSCGIQTSYTSKGGGRRRAGVGRLLAAVRAFGLPVDRLQDVPSLLTERRLELQRRPIDPVVVAWDGRMPAVEIRIPAAIAGQRIWGRVRLEGAEEIDAAPAWAPVRPTGDAAGESLVAVRLSFRMQLPIGYHRLRLEAGPMSASALVISSPRALPIEAAKSWGVFLPLYALRSARSWGVGDLTDLGDLLEWTTALGGNVVATLPILASFLDEPFEPSPYSPASRLFWNELFLDVTMIPELDRSPDARRVLASEHFQKEIANLRRAEIVDYRAAMAAKRQVLEPLARTLFAEGGPRRADFESHLASDDRLPDYAAFRAACERHRSGWQSWPARERGGALPAFGGDEGAFDYHRYVQWLAEQQLQEAARRAGSGGTSLYFDFPLGVNPAGYDVWRERDVFALETSAGAPPDLFFTSGQDWGFHPIHPEAARDQGYRYPISCLRHMFRHAGVLRIDHVMGLHRLYWIPQGLSASDGVYVRYPADELYAILLLEADRAGATVVGEDLGVVPGYVRPALARHGIHRSYVLPWELTEDPAQPMRPVPERSFASLNTHDMPTFAAYWRGEDIGLRVERGWLDAAGVAMERRSREAHRAMLVRYLRRRGWLEGVTAADGADGVSDEELLAACLSELAASNARRVIVNLEDLWLETRPQNVPGTVGEYPNWRRVARHPLERIRDLPHVVDTLRRIDTIRRGKTL
jgi:4-alpha-glucanotransferase